MRSNFKPLGNFIREVDIRDVEKSVDLLLGVSIQKKFIPSIANTIGTDMSTYKIIKKNQFAYGPVTSRNGDKISVALLEEVERAIISQAYFSFEIIDSNELLSEYLMMWFRRPEFDRYARFMSHGSARELFDWESMRNTLLPVPSIAKQKEIVKEYKIIQNRIVLNQKLIQMLEETAQAIYKEWFVDFEFPDENGRPYKSSGGKLVPNKELEIEVPEKWNVNKLSDFCEIKGGKRLPKGQELNDENSGRPYIKVADMSNSKFVVLNEKFQYVDDETQKTISHYVVSNGDVIVSIVGTIGMINVVDESLDKANLTENCVRLTNFENINSDFIYHYLYSSIGQRVIEMRTVGGVQGKLPLYNIQSIPILTPNPGIMEKFEKIIRNINVLLRNYSNFNCKLTDLNDVLLSKIATIEN
ncbi:type I restriction enzyme S subunit [Undibacterium sp. GrIS 1.2]|uniref:restriction endonuclease subunit S n=1 Tax=Undibacterium sp. GrIS 1.2 TaxID=3143933 RepID=UPI00339375BE